MPAADRPARTESAGATVAEGPDLRSPFRALRLPGALTLALLAALPARAEGGPSAESQARLAQAIAAAGCVVNELNQRTILSEAEMDETEAGVIVSLWMTDGRAVPEGDSNLRLKIEGCK
ncbi:hypothetical protein [Frigidibacter sp. ROC022]|uniref:hypothetical protein n=1 Tax=Frigidibacter sp. ROC022 TaxID=2971796 RepID=UPI00215A6E33|nr:hypothetical protein [Frigidibacter sp. ROC022]MCR8723274.1 hypothetical protein [Frigidibacter sp. ROC022]